MIAIHNGLGERMIITLHHWIPEWRDSPRWIQPLHSVWLPTRRNTVRHAGKSGHHEDHLFLGCLASTGLVSHRCIFNLIQHQHPSGGVAPFIRNVGVTVRLRRSSHNRPDIASPGIPLDIQHLFQQFTGVAPSQHRSSSRRHTTRGCTLQCRFLCAGLRESPIKVSES